MAPFGKLWCDGHEVAPPLHPLAKAVGKVTPEVNGMLTGMAFNVLIANVSIMGLTCHLEKAAKNDDIKKVVNRASEDSLMDILGYIEDQVVSGILIK